MFKIIEYRELLGKFMLSEILRAAGERSYGGIYIGLLTALSCKPCSIRDSSEAHQKPLFTILAEELLEAEVVRRSISGTAVLVCKGHCTI